MPLDRARFHSRRPISLPPRWRPRCPGRHQQLASSWQLLWFSWPPLPTFDSSIAAPRVLDANWLPATDSLSAGSGGNALGRRVVGGTLRRTEFIFSSYPSFWPLLLCHFARSERGHHVSHCLPLQALPCYCWLPGRCLHGRLSRASKKKASARPKAQHSGQDYISQGALFTVSILLHTLPLTLARRSPLSKLCSSSGRFCFVANIFYVATSRTSLSSYPYC